MSKTPDSSGNLAAGIEKMEYESRPNSESGWQRFKRDRTAVWSGGFLLAIAAICSLSPWIAPYSYMEQNLAASAAGPSAAHWLGTDLLGRDVLSRLMQGGMISLFVGLIATTVALLLGICYGVLAAEVGGRQAGAEFAVAELVAMFHKGVERGWGGGRIR
jgi:oligopeptide transport system permease protein